MVEIDVTLSTHITGLDIDMEELFESQQTLEDFIVKKHLMKLGIAAEMMDYLMLTGVEES